MEALCGPDGLPLCNRDGRRLLKLTSPLAYWSERLNRVVVVREGFVTDLASIPRVPIFYVLLNDAICEESVIHDFFYSTGEVTRKEADAVLLEAMEAMGAPAWKRKSIYDGVRLFGEPHYKRG